LSLRTINLKNLLPFWWAFTWRTVLATIMVTMSLTLISTVIFSLIDFTAEDWLTSVLASIVQFPCSIWALVEALKLKYKGYVIEMVEQ
jgi:hypothetical protein